MSEFLDFSKSFLNLNGLSIVIIAFLCCLTLFYMNKWLSSYKELNVSEPERFNTTSRNAGVVGGGATNNGEIVFHDYGDLNKRADFIEVFGLYGQILLSVFVLTFITILILSGQLKAEVGIPIISGISGYAISKTTKVNRNQDTESRTDKINK